MAKRRKDGPSLFGDEAAPEVGAYGPAKRGATLAEPPAPADRPDFSGSESVCIPRPAGGWTATRLLAAAEIALGARPTLDLLDQLVVCRKCEGVSRPSPRLRARCAALLCGASQVQSFAGFAEEHFGGVPFRPVDQVEQLRARADRLERAIREALPWLVEMGGRPPMPLTARNLLAAAIGEDPDLLSPSGRNDCDGTEIDLADRGEPNVAVEAPDPAIPAFENRQKGIHSMGAG